MARLFLSHSSANNDTAVEVRDWLAENGWRDVFLDLDPERGIVAGQRWKDALQKAAYRCEVVLALVSKEWLASGWCKSEIDAARLMGKKVMAALVGVDKGAVPLDLIDEQFIDLTGDPQAYRRLKEGLKRAGLDPTTFPFDADRPPYPGFAYLEEKDAAVFFGRDAQIVRGLDEIRRLARTGVTRMFVILGASGSGKSSFLRAGLWPRLKRDDLAWLPLPIVRPERAAISGKYGLAESLYETVSDPRFAEGVRQRGLPRSRLDIQDFIEKTDDGLARLFAALRDIAQAGASEEKAAPPTILLAIDQGEELFNDDGQEEDKRLIDIVTRTLAADARTMAILVMRSDAFPLVQNEPTLAALPKDTFTLDMMLEGSYRAVIEGPARLLDPPLLVDPQLVDALLEDISGQDALPLLAFTLRHLYDNTRVDNALTLAGYDKIGRVKGVIAQTVDQAYAEAVVKGEAPKDKEERLKLARSAFIPHLAQVNPAGQFVRRVSPRDKIPDEARPLVDRFAEQRLLIRDRRQDAEVIEVAHEALLRQPPFSDWLSEDREFLLWRDRLTQARTAFQADERGLFAGRELAVARSYMQTRAERDFEPADLAFIRDSVAADDKRRADEAEEARRREAAEKEEQDRRLRDAQRIAEEQTRAAAAQKRFTRAAVVGFVIALALAGVAGWQYLSADHAEKEARSQREIAVKQKDAADQAKKDAYEQRDRAFKAEGAAKEATAKAEASAEEAKANLREAQRALADAINSDLGFTVGDWAPQTSGGLWKLARADEAVKSDYVSGLANNAGETGRAAPGFAQISRALGLLRPSPDEAQGLVAAAISALSTNSDTGSLVAEIVALAPKLTAEQAGKALEQVLNLFGKIGSPYPPYVADAIKALAVKLSTEQAGQALEQVLNLFGKTDRPFVVEAIQALAPKITDAQAAQALNNVLNEIGQTTNPYVLRALTQAILALPVKLTDAEASQALDPILDQFNKANNAEAFRALAEAILALPVKLTDAGAAQALSKVLNQIGKANNRDARPAVTEAIKALAPKLTDAQAAQALEQVLNQIGQTANPDTLNALAETIQALPVKLTDAQAGRALEQVLNQIGGPTDFDALTTVTHAIQALAPQLTDAQASQALDKVLNQIGRPKVYLTDPFPVQAVAAAIQALAPKITDAQAAQAVDNVLNEMGKTTDYDIFEALAEVIKALAPNLTDAEASQALDPILDQFNKANNADAFRALAEAIQALPVKLTDAQASHALDPVLKQFGKTDDAGALRALAKAIQALPVKLTDAQASHALDPVLNQIGKTTKAGALRALGEAIRALPVELTAEQAGRALDPLVKQLGPTTDADFLEALPEAIRALAPKLTDAGAAQALSIVLDQFNKADNAEAFQALAEAIQALPVKLTDAQADQVLGKVLNEFGKTTNNVALQAFSRAIQALASKLGSEQARKASEPAQASLAWAASDGDAADWARALTALLDRAGDPEKTQELVAAIAFPTAAGTATDILLDAVRAGHSDAPAKEAGTNAALEWLANHYPEVLRPPACPQPLQPYEISRLKCPTHEAEAAPSAGAPAEAR